MINLKSVAAGFLLASYVSAPAWALNIADVPLFQSTTVSPNVMLLIDNSGSMDHITWKEGYADETAYPAAEACSASAGSWQWQGGWVWVETCSTWTSLVQGATYYRSSALQLDCSANQRKFRFAGVERCLLMPDPVGSGSTRFKGNYLSYLLGQGVPDAQIPTVHRMAVARDVSTSLVNSNPGMRFGLMAFDRDDNSDGGRVLAGIGSAASTITTQIDGLRSETWTPLAEAYYEMTRYYRGMAANYTGDNFSSPIQYRCQKNFGIVVTDGLPTYDTSFPADDPLGGANIPDWDGVGNGLAEGVQYSDGLGGAENGEGSFLYLDDIAKFAYDSDLRGAGNDQAGVSFNDVDFSKQNLTTYTVGFSVDNQMLRDAAERGNGEYYTANSAEQLNNVLGRALQSIKERTSSAAAIATNSTRLDTDTLIYQAKFNSGDWSGELIAYGINTDGSVGLPRWRTGDSGLIPDAASRNVYTYTGSAGVSFSWGNLAATQKTALSNNDADGAVIVNWLRGGSSGATLSAASSDEVLRNRTTILGDIVNSDPVFVGAQSYGYTVPNDPLVATEPADSYQAYVDAKAVSGAVKTVMVGANDGMLHGFNAETGRELFAYFPSSLYPARNSNPGATPGLRYLTKSTYTHKYYVDGSIGVGDVYSTAWKTYAVGGLGAGGRGVYALNITSPSNFSASDVLWEITAPDTSPASPATNGSDWNDLGHVYGPPVVARVQDGTWVAIFSNGYNSNTGRAALYIVNATTGALIKRIYAGAGTATAPDSVDAPATPNGLSAPAVVVDASRKVTTVYAGDLKGHLWKFNLNDGSAANWDVAYTTGSGQSEIKAPLFTARNAAGQIQPITSGLEIGAHPNGGMMLYFGTGKYFETSDSTVGANPQKQSFYGIWDKIGNSNASNTSGGPITSLDRSLLRQQTITTETSDYRVVSMNAISTAQWAGLRGWYLDLVPPSGTAAGERAVSLPLLRAGRIIFTTVIPSADPCLAGGTSWLMEMDSVTGGNLNYPVLDVNDDGEFNSADKVACGGGLLCNPGGMRSREGIIKTPGIVSAGDTEYKYSGGSSGNILVITEKGSVKEGRMSWRQLR